MQDTERILDDLRNGDTHRIRAIFTQYRPLFFQWTKGRFTASREDLEDVWQDTIIIFFENVKNGRLRVLEYSLQAYLFAIARNQLLKRQRQAGHMQQIAFEEERYEEIEYDDTDWEALHSEHLRVLEPAFESLSEKCRDFLRRRYYLGQSIDLIRETENLKSNNVVSASISRCLKHLKDLIRKNISPHA